MRKLFLIIIALATMFSCFGPRKKIITTEHMEIITAEIFVANAYGSFAELMMQDSIDMYEPIFNKYGYTATDMLYTITELTKRKSVRYTDILEGAILRIERVHDSLDRIVKAQDTVDMLMVKTYSTRVYDLPELVVDNIKDTSNLSIKVPVEPGSYELSFRYFIDSEDKNSPISYRYGIINKSGRYRSISTYHMKKSLSEKRDLTIPNVSEQDSLLYLQLGVYPKTMTGEPHIRFDSLTLYHLPVLESVKDSFRDRWFPNELLPYINESNKKDSRAVGPYLKWAASASDSLHKQ
ncbi:MAG: hypothetical protein R3Y15_05570 [Rikenellaceae bacterium]